MLIDQLLGHQLWSPTSCHRFSSQMEEKRKVVFKLHPASLWLRLLGVVPPPSHLCCVTIYFQNWPWRKAEGRRLHSPTIIRFCQSLLLIPWCYSISFTVHFDLVLIFPLIEYIFCYPKQIISTARYSAEKTHHVLYFWKAAALRISNMILRGDYLVSTWGNLGEILGKSWGNLGEILGESWGNLGDIKGKS